MGSILNTAGDGPRVSKNGTSKAGAIGEKPIAAPTKAAKATFSPKIFVFMFSPPWDFYQFLLYHKPVNSASGRGRLLIHLIFRRIFAILMDICNI